MESTLTGIINVTDTENDDDGCLERTWFNSDQSAGELNLCPSATNSSEDDFNTFYFYQTEQLAFLWILLILIVVGNMAVLVALSMSSARKSRMNYFIKHLAIADLSVGVISVLTDIVWKITVAWHAGNIACKVIRFSQFHFDVNSKRLSFVLLHSFRFGGEMQQKVLVTYSSTYVLVALSIDRYDAICHPMNFSRGWRRARILVAVAWILSAIFSSPMLVLYEEGLVQGQVQCWIDFTAPWQWQLYLTLVAVSLLVLPALLIFACYIVIVRTIWVQSAALTSSMPSANRNNNNTAGINRTGGSAGTAMLDEDQESRRASSRGIIPRAKIKTVKMTFVIVFENEITFNYYYFFFSSSPTLVFILCWAPYIVFDLLQVYGHIPKSKTMIAVATFIQSLAPLNSAANPLIYCLFSTHLCRNLRKIPALEWMAVKLENAVHSIGLCPDWNCCAADGSVDHPSLQNRTTSRGGTAHTRTNHRNSHHSRQMTQNQFRGHFHRLANNSSSTGTTVNTTTTTITTSQVANASAVKDSGRRDANLIRRVSSSDVTEVVAVPTPAIVKEPLPANSRSSQWV
ncbi:putative Gonadotropin-releasing hormone II receptor [Daphnia magna]|uniref:Putative Gonadotropin-releasing hormone II receptor n=1 Tax=Daphnia magna TaxID=35525 RepID=A0A164W1E4_9CRUS|nr:putative Gonadotropin-releasing hormone II receptor [Daphnia magna]